MELATHHNPQVRVTSTVEPPGFVPLHLETRAGVETNCAAFHLNRQAQTLRGWACKENGPIRPLRINGRLMWSTKTLRELCGVGQ